MADIGQIKATVGGLESGVKKAFIDSFTYVLNDIRVGLPDNQRRATNLRWTRLDGRTHTTANTEFSIVHGLGRVPVVIFPALNLGTVNATLPQLTVSRAADLNRVYFTSPSTGAAFMVFIE